MTHAIVRRAAWLIDGVALVVTLALFAAFAPPVIDSAPYNYDESDYMWAAASGFATNYMDLGTMGIPEFSRLGWKAAKHQISGASLSAYIRERNDVLFYRHYHGPVYYAALHAAAPFHNSDEQGTRKAGLVFHALGCLLLYGGVLWLIPGSEGRIAALLFFVIYLFSPTAIESAMAIAPHLVFVFLALLATILTAKWMRTTRTGYWYAAMVASAAATCTLEIGLGLIPALAACCWFERGRLFNGWTLRQWLGFVVRSTAVWAAALLVIWPPALLKLSLMKGCLFMAYLASSRSAAFGGTAFLDGWRLRLLASPVEWLAVAAAMVISIVMFRRRSPASTTPLPMFAFGVVALMAMLRVSTNSPKYTLIYLAPLELFASIMLAYALARLRPRTRYVLLGLICAGGIGASVWRLQPLRSRAEPSGPVSWRLIDFARQERLENVRLLAPQDVVPTLHYYFPKATIRGYRDAAELQSLAECRCYDGALAIAPALRYTAFVPANASAPVAPQ